MPSLIDIKARIKAVENIKKITRAMQLVAAAKFNRAQNRARSTRPYSEELGVALGVLAAISESEADASSADSTLDLSFVDATPMLEIDAGPSGAPGESWSNWMVRIGNGISIPSRPNRS